MRRCLLKTFILLWLAIILAPAAQAGVKIVKVEHETGSSWKITVVNEGPRPLTTIRLRAEATFADGRTENIGSTEIDGGLNIQFLLDAPTETGIAYAGPPTPAVAVGQTEVMGIDTPPQMGVAKKLTPRVVVTVDDQGNAVGESFDLTDVVKERRPYAGLIEWVSATISQANAESLPPDAVPPKIEAKSEACRGPEYCGHTSLSYVDAVAKRIRGKEWQVLKEDEFTWMHELGAEMKHNAEVAKKWAEVRE